MHIEYYGEFLVLAEELNFHAAAERLHVSQSALSKHIAELEKHHRIQLFDRGRTSVKLTAKGAVFLEQAADLYSRYEELTNLFAQMEDEEKPLTVAGILDNPLDFPLVSRTFEYCKERGVGRLPIFIPCESTVVEDNIEMVRSGEADCVVLYATDELLEHIPDSDQLTLEEIYRVPLDAIVRRGHPLAARQSITLDDLEGRTIIRLVGVGFHQAGAGRFCLRVHHGRPGYRHFAGAAHSLFRRAHAKCRSGAGAAGRRPIAADSGGVLAGGRCFAHD